MCVQGGPGTHLLLNFPEHGLHLVFEGFSQRLCLIEVFDLSRVQVSAGVATAYLSLLAWQCVASAQPVRFLHPVLVNRSWCNQITILL